MDLPLPRIRSEEATDDRRLLQGRCPQPLEAQARTDAGDAARAPAWIGAERQELPCGLHHAVLPDVSVDQYAATLSTWFGASGSDLGVVFPNLGNFGTTNLGFMSA